MPNKYRSYITVWRRLKRWSEKDIWDIILGSLKDDSYQRRQISSGIVAVDSSFVDAKKEKVSSITDSKREKELRFMQL
jgi:hypothetical protein